jgi:hypothetical protein
MKTGIGILNTATMVQRVEVQVHSREHCKKS